MAKVKNPIKKTRPNEQIGKSANLFQVVPITFFTAIIILLIRMMSYHSNQDQFFWTAGGTSFVDFFSLIKSQAILLVTVLVLLILLYKMATQTFAVKKSAVYIPMLVYSAFVLLSYFSSSYKEFALFGWNDRFEGTLILLAYMVMLFYIINTVTTEQHVKWILYPLAITTTFLGFIGITQYYMADFFQTTFGKKLITPSSYWDRVDQLKFNFEGGQIYQTVFNPNYVSFYLTLLVPLFAMLFIREKRIAVKSAFGFIYALSLFNLIGSASSNGIAGLAVSFLLSLIILNKRIIEWKKPVLFLFLITLVVGSLTFARFLPQIASDIKAAVVKNGVTLAATVQNVAAKVPAAAPAEPVASSYKLDYFETGKDHLTVGMGGDQLIISIMNEGSSTRLVLADRAGKNVAIATNDQTGLITVTDPRFNKLGITRQQSKGISYLLLYTGKTLWPFAITKEGFFFRNGLGKLVALINTPHFGFDKNPAFGSYRGYIWSRSLPLLKDTIFVGRGADTFCIYFPQNDYAGRYSANWTPDIIVDKAHNMYLATALNTGVISLLALLGLFGVYLRQSFPLYRKALYTDFLTFCGSGIFIGISGFLISALFNDSSVSVMPLFYGLLGTGLAINRLLLNRNTA